MAERTDDTLRWIVVVLVALLAVPVVGMALMAPMMGGWMGWGHEGPAVRWWFASLVPLVVLAAVGYALYRLLDGAKRRDPALEELRVAYARGEMDEEEFERRKERLKD